jgi:parallel beta-helix repeat protein
MKYYLRTLLIICVIIQFAIPVFAYEEHEPIIIRHTVEGNSASNPLIIEGYEISNPGGPCILIENVDHVIVRNNYLHDCGTGISAEVIANNPRDDDCVGRMENFMDTGALNIFRVGSVEIHNNKIVNNDYSIRVDGHEKQMIKASIYNNSVFGTHRSHFIWVKNADNVLVYDNDVKDNGLGEFFDNEALLKILEGEDLGCGDGRSQGIAIHGCNNVKVYGNRVDNSSSDGIGIMGDPGKPSSDVEVYGNEVVENGEQGIWLAGAHHTKIFNNTVYLSKHRIDETGGSSGIMLETDVINVDIYHNEIYYNDMYGISLTAGTNISIYNNNIYNNGDGGIGISGLFYIGQEDISNIRIINNKIHNNRKCAICIDNDYFQNISIINNKFKDNGGNPIHHQNYKDQDFSLHLEDWTIDNETVFLVNPEYKFKDLVIDENFVSPETKKIADSSKKTDESVEIIASGQKEGKTGLAYVFEQLIESWEATLVGFFIICMIIFILAFKIKKRNIHKIQ